MLKNKFYQWVLWPIWMAGMVYSGWVSLVFRDVRQPHVLVIGVMILIIVTLFLGSFSQFISYGKKNLLFSLFVAVFVFASTFIVEPSSDNFLIVIPENSGISKARVIKDVGFLEHPFSDKLVSAKSSYTIGADVVINTDNGKKFIARSHKKEFKVIDPIAVYHRIGEEPEKIEEFLRSGLKRCFNQEMIGKQFFDMLVKKTRDLFFIQSHVCELGLSYYGLEPSGGNTVSFVDFRITDILPLQLQIQ